jgi:hypothetical protein
VGSRLLGTALLLGAGALAVTAVLAGPPLLRAGRPLLRQGLKRGLEVYTRLRASAAEMIEDVEDLVAEVRGELADASQRDDEADAAKRSA